MRTLACLLLGAAMVGLYHLLPRTRPGRPFRAALLVLSGFILAQGGLSAAIVALGLVPKGSFHDLLHQLTGYDGERPVILLIGSSFSEKGIDPDVLAEALGSSGRAAAVQRLAVGGAPLVPRQAKAATRAVRNRRWLRQQPVVPGSPDALQRPHGRDDGWVERVVGIALAGERRRPQPVSALDAGERNPRPVGPSCQPHRVFVEQRASPRGHHL